MTQALPNLPRCVSAERLTSSLIRQVLTGELDRVEVPLPHGCDARLIRNRASGLLRQVKDRSMVQRDHPWPLSREHAACVYLDPANPYVLVCDVTGHDSRKDRAYAPVLRLAVGESCTIAPATAGPRSVHLRLCAIAKQAKDALGSRPAFHARVEACGVYRITRLPDGTNPRFDPFSYAQAEHDDRLEQLIQEELSQ